MEYLRAIAAYQLSIPGYPHVTDSPVNPEQGTFASLCDNFWEESMRYVAEAQRLQRGRSDTAA